MFLMDFIYDPAVCENFPLYIRFYYLPNIRYRRPMFLLSLPDLTRLYVSFDASFIFYFLLHSTSPSADNIFIQQMERTTNSNQLLLNYESNYCSLKHFEVKFFNRSSRIASLGT